MLRDKTSWFIGVVVIGAVILAGVGIQQCGQPSPADTGAVNIQEYGNNVYYFESKKGFGAALSNFLKTRPYHRLVSISSLNTGAYGATRGYWVIMEPKEVQTQESDKR